MNKKADDKSRPRRSTGRRVAEWVSLGVSLVLICGIAGLLVWEGVRRDSPLLPCDAVPQLDRAAKAGDRFVLPILVTNRGRQTMRDLKVQLEFRGEGGKNEEREFVLDYLGERSEQTIYAYFDQDPRTLDVRAMPVQYRLE